MTKQILIIPGSTRKGSVNAKLADTLARAVVDAGATANRIDLSDYDLPLYNEDLKAAAIPAGGIKLAEAIAAGDGVIVVSPEYNSSIPPLLKNAIDWVSVLKPEHGAPDTVFKDKICALASCSPGALGGIRGLYHLRSVVMNVGMQIVTEQLAVGNAGSAFDDDGNLINDRERSKMKSLIEAILKRA